MGWRQLIIYIPSAKGQTNPIAPVVTQVISRRTYVCVCFDMAVICSSGLWYGITSNTKGGVVSFWPINGLFVEGMGVLAVYGRPQIISYVLYDVSQLVYCLASNRIWVTKIKNLFMASAILIGALTAFWRNSLVDSRHMADGFPVISITL